MKSRLTICFVAGDLADGGGVNRVVSDLSAIFAKQLGADVTVLSLGTTGEPTYPLSDRVKLEAIADGRPIGWRKALSRLRRDKPDVVIGSWTQANFILILGLLLSGIRVIAAEHTSWYFHRRRVRALRRLIYPLAWRVTVLNPSELAHYRKYLGNVRLIPNPVPPMPRSTVGKGEKLIIAIGHLEPRKNFFDAIQAMALSRLEDDGWDLAIIGAGPEEQLLRDAIGAAGLERTHIHPPTSDLASWYNRASLTLVTAKLEVFSLVLAEAMSAGVVPIAYTTDGPSFILDGFRDHLVPVGDVAAMAERMRGFAAEPIGDALRSSLAASINERFSPERIAREWEQLLNDSRSGSSSPVRR